jgi:Big-like domain-containing protein
LSGRDKIAALPPTVVITNPSNNTTVFPGSLIVSGSSQDNIGGTGVNNVAVKLDNRPYVTATGTSNWSITINITQKGIHQLRARARDNAGNFGFSSIVRINVR